MKDKDVKYTCGLTAEEKTIIEHFRELDAYGRAKTIAAMMNQVDRLMGRLDYGRYGGEVKPAIGKIIEFEIIRFPNGKK